MNKEQYSNLEENIDTLISNWYSYAGILHTHHTSTAFLKKSIIDIITANHLYGIKTPTVTKMQDRISFSVKKWELDSKRSKTEWQGLHWSIFELIYSTAELDYEIGPFLHKAIINRIKPVFEKLPYNRRELETEIAFLMLDYMKVNTNSMLR